MDEKKPSYRRTVYEAYPTILEGDQGAVAKVRTARDAQVYSRYLRGWLPGDKSAKILDAGCGTGRLLSYLGGLGYQNIGGIDISPPQVEAAAKVCETVALGDALEVLRSAEVRYHLIVALDVIEHLKKDEALEFLRLAFERLEDGGRLVLQTPNAESPYYGSLFHGDFSHEMAYTPRLLSGLLKETGFDAVQSRELGPVPSARRPWSIAQWSLWQAVRQLRGMITLAETGSTGSPIRTRAFMISGVKSGPRQAR